MWAGAHILTSNILFALFRVIKIVRYENLPCSLPAKIEHLKTRQNGHLPKVQNRKDFINVVEFAL